MSEFSVTLPLPSFSLSPNARGHWAIRHRATKAARKVAWYWFKRALPKDWQTRPVEVCVDYHCPRSADGYRPLDVQNAIAALKPAIDGMVDAGVVPDDSWKWVAWGAVRITRSKIAGKPPGVTITVVQE